MAVYKLNESYDKYRSERDRLENATVEEFENFNKALIADKYRLSEANPYDIKTISDWISIRDDYTYTEDTNGTWYEIDIKKDHSKYGTNYIYIDPEQKVWRIKQTAGEFYGSHKPRFFESVVTNSNRKSKRAIKERYGKGKHIIWDSEVDIYDEDYMEDVKANQYQDYLDDCESFGEEPEDFEDWYESYADSAREFEWEFAQDDLDDNVLPEIEKQINNNILLLSGSYGSNYSDFRPSGDGGIMWNNGIKGFRDFLSDFWRVQITTENGILGAVCGDHDGTISGQLFTLPDNPKELIKALGYEEVVREDYEDQELDNIESYMEDYFYNDLYYGNIDERDLNANINLLKPIKDTISGYSNKDDFSVYKWDREGLGENFKSRKPSNKRVKKSKKISEARYTGNIYTDEEFQEEVDKFLNNYDLKAINYEISNDGDGADVCLEDQVSRFEFWLFLWVNKHGDLDSEWDSTMFFTDDFDDAVQSEIQEDTYFFEEANFVAEDYLLELGVLRYDDRTGTYSIRNKSNKFRVDDWEN